jgi:hypothetical protein
MRKLFFIIAIFLVGFFVAFYHLVIADDKELLEKLVFPEAYEVVSGYDERLGLTAISYKVKLKYPSKEVLKFCNKKLKELGWEKYILYPTKESDRNWMDFIDGTREGEPFVHQLGAYWNDKEKNKMVSLLLRYYSYNLTRKERLLTKTPNTDVLNVIVQVGPYVELMDKEKNVKIQEDNQTWSQSFQFYLSHIKPMSPTDRNACKKFLKEILEDLDSKNHCKRDNDCTLIDEEPFGTHIPFPHNLADAIALKMKNYRERCHDGKTHSIRYNDLINTPVCWEERCMVKTSFRKDSTDR